ncbi:MAG TPA: hypothetical protein VF630_14165 [Hymenobacter sp.]|jgi:hypothetical protein
MGRILQSDPAFPLPNSRQIIAARTRIIDGYDTVSNEIVGAARVG